jgi:hypothetical protein
VTVVYCLVFEKCWHYGKVFRNVKVFCEATYHFLFAAVKKTSQFVTLALIKNRDKDSIPILELERGSKVW